MEVTLERLIEIGLESLRAGRHEQALAALGHAVARLGNPARLPPPALACYAWALAASDRRQLADAVHLCKAAAGRAFAHADAHLALGRTYDLAGWRSLALKAYATGLGLDPQHAALRRAREEIGVRARPPFPFLSRSHLLNRFLGRLRHQLTRRGGRRPAVQGAGVDSP